VKGCRLNFFTLSLSPNVPNLSRSTSHSQGLSQYLSK